MRRLIKNRTITWLAVLLIFVVLLVLANWLTEGETFAGVAPVVVIAIALAGLVGVYRVTMKSRGWRVRPRDVAIMTFGAALYAGLAYVFDKRLDLSVGQVALRPMICIPILFGYAFGPVVGFFTGAVGGLLGDVFTAFGVFPAWVIGSGLSGMVPGLTTFLSEERRNLRYLSTLVILLVAIAATIVFVHPLAPEPWTDEVKDFSFWGWALIIGGVVMVANRLLLEQVSVALAAVNVWGTLGIIVGNGFVSVAHIWMNEYSLTTALVGEFAPAAAADILNLMIFTPLVLASYNAIRERIRHSRGNDS
ncbi:MAG: ECF transporter S component [Anaerolineae bacterium]|jgi:uncharacterized membrane protein